MAYQPQGEIQVAAASYTLTKEEYGKGRLLVERRHGSLLNAPVFYLLGLALFALGMTSFFYDGLSMVSVLLAAVRGEHSAPMPEEGGRLPGRVFHCGRL